MTKLFTSHWRSGLLPDLDATIIGISRGTPRRAPGFRYRVLRSLAPSDHVWAQTEQDKFESAYAAQLEGLGAARIMSDLERIGEEHGGKALCLLCWERLADPDEWCHRRMLAGFLEREAGIVVPELEPGMLPQREDVAERRLC